MREGEGQSLLAGAARAVLRRLPRHGDLSLARRLARRGDAARDAGRFLVAAALYEESLAVVPGRAAVHLQCGHMWKEGGLLPAAGRHYLAAQALRPGDAEIRLQLGHFHKLAGRPDEAAASYRSALELRPGWTAALDELARLPSVAAGAGAMPDLLVPELLPGDTGDPVPPAEGVTLWRLGHGRGRVLRGVAAIRGMLVAHAERVELVMALDGAELRRLPLSPARNPGKGPTTFVFNLWQDFGQIAPGRHRLELRFTDGGGLDRVHGEAVVVAAPQPEAAHPGSDALVAIDPADPRDAEAQVRARPSMVRRAARTPLPSPVRTILVQRLDQLGDLVASVPALVRLREHFPDARIVGLLTPANAALGRTLGVFDAVEEAAFAEDERTGRRTMDVAEQVRLAHALRAHAPDVAIDFAEVAGSRPVLRLSGAPFLAGFKPRDFPWLSAGLDLAVPDPVNGTDAVPPARRLVALVEAIAAMRAPGPAPLERAEVDAGLLRPWGIEPGRYLLLHTGARLAYTRWPGFAALAERLLAETALPIVMLADPGTPGLPAARDRLRVVEGPLPFDRFDALLSGAAVFVGNDSGAKHLAALRGTPVVSLHMARLNWSEWGQEASGLVISRRVPCAGCGIGQRGEECGMDHACLHDIGVGEVADAVLSLL